VVRYFGFLRSLSLDVIRQVLGIRLSGFVYLRFGANARLDTFMDPLC
jgi:hypothetical protein